MSEETTQEQNGARSFEERILARLDTIDARLEKLEAKDYDTKPVWQEVLTFLNEMHREMGAGFRNTERQIGVLSKDMVQLRADVGDAVDRLHDVERKG